MKNTVKQQKNSKRRAIKPGVNIPPVRRSFYAVVPTWGTWDNMEVLLLGRSSKMARRLYEHWNEMGKRTLTKKRMSAYQLTIRKFNA